MMQNINLSAWGEIPDQLYDTTKLAGNVGISPQRFLEGIGLFNKANGNNKRVAGVGGNNNNRQIDFPITTKGFTENPFDTFSSKGIREKYRPISYATLREMEHKNPVISAIVNCRCCQLRPFSKESRHDYEPGYQIKLKDKDRKANSKEKEKIKQITEWFRNAGRTDFEGWMERRDNLLGFMEKACRDFLVIDRVATELRYDNMNEIVDFWPMDGALIHRVVRAGYRGEVTDFDPRAYDTGNTKLGQELLEARLAQIPEDVEKIKFVQRINGRLSAAYENKDLILDYTQKRTDLLFADEGYPKTEQALHAVTAFLFALAYNAEQFNSGTIPKIALAFKDGNFSEEQLINLQDQWIAAFRGIKGAWRIPMLNQEVQVIDLLKNPKDMEHSKYMEFTGSLICAIFNIDPQEIGMRWQYAQNVLNDNSGSRLKHSKDRGLNDLLGQMADLFNRIMYFAGWADKYYFAFTGIEPDDAKERSALETEAVKRDTTINELRKKKDMEPIEGGDIILDPTFMQGIQQAQMAEDAGGEPGEFEGAPGGAEDVFGEAADEAVEDMFKADKRVKSARTLLI